MQNKKRLLRPEGTYALIVKDKKAYKKDGAPVLPMRLVESGGSDEKIEIYHGDGTVEIGGVRGSIENWREILLPLLAVVEGEEIGEYLTENRAEALESVKRMEKEYKKLNKKNLKNL